MQTIIRARLLEFLLVFATVGARAGDDPPAQQGKVVVPPHIKWGYPAGGQRGTSVNVTICGSGLSGATGIRVTDKNITGSVAEVEDKKVKFEDKTIVWNLAKVVVNIAADAEPGERDLRIITPVGVSNRARFFVGQLPEVNEVEPNDSPDQAQALPSLPVVVNGQIGALVDRGFYYTAADRDFYRFSAKAGQTLVFAVDARAICPYFGDAVPGFLQAVLTLRDAGGKELAYADGFRHRQDTLLIYKVPADGQYVLEVRDALYRAREDFVYRLTAGPVPYITDVFPLGGQRGATVPVELHGVNLPESTLKLSVPQKGPPFVPLRVSAAGVGSNTIRFAAGDCPEVTEAEPNDSLDKAQRVTMPVTINGRIDKPGDCDCFVFAGAAKQEVTLQVQARRLDSPLDSVLTLYKDGKQLSKNDDTDFGDEGEPLVTHHADSRITLILPAAGDYVAKIGDARNKGGPEYAYRLSIAPRGQDYGLRVLSGDNPPQVGPGQSVALNLLVTREKYLGPIRLALKNMPEGFTMQGDVNAWTPPYPWVKEPGGDPENVQVRITAPANAPPGVLSPLIEATATIDGREVVHQAIPVELVQQAFQNWRHRVPLRDLPLNIRPPDPYFELAVVQTGGQAINAPLNGKVGLTIKAIHGKNGAGPIALALDGEPDGFGSPGGLIEAGRNEGTLTVQLENTFKNGIQLKAGDGLTAVVKGTMEVRGERLVRLTEKIALKAVPPASLAAPPAEKKGPVSAPAPSPAATSPAK